MVELTSTAGAPLFNLASREFNNSFGSRASRAEIAGEPLSKLNVAFSRLAWAPVVLP